MPKDDWSKSRVRPKQRNVSPRIGIGKLPNHYRVRSSALSMMGFKSYREYLDSELWQQIKERILARDNSKCVPCGRDAYTVHHTTYSVAVLAGKEDSQLVSVCRGCHRRAEFAGEEKRLNSFDVFKSLKTSKCKRLKKDKSFRPMCRCCRLPQKKPLGREGICLHCYKRFREKVHEIAKRNDEAALID